MRRTEIPRPQEAPVEIILSFAQKRLLDPDAIESDQVQKSIDELMEEKPDFREEVVAIVVNYKEAHFPEEISAARRSLIQVTNRLMVMLREKGLSEKALKQLPIIKSRI